MYSQNILPAQREGEYEAMSSQILQKKWNAKFFIVFGISDHYPSIQVLWYIILIT